MLNSILIFIPCFLGSFIIVRLIGFYIERKWFYTKDDTISSEYFQEWTIEPKGNHDFVFCNTTTQREITVKAPTEYEAWLTLQAQFSGGAVV